MDAIECPYCEVEISLARLDAEGGVCPECGHPISPDIYNEDDEDVEEGGEEDDEDEDDI